MFNPNGNNVFGQSGDNPAFDPGGPIGQEGYDGRTNGGTNMVTSNGDGQQEEEVIVMQDVGPLRSWWEGLNPTTKMMFKALGVGALIFAGKYAVEKTIEGIKKKGQDELMEEEEDSGDEETEDTEGE